MSTPNADSKGHASSLVWKARPIFISSTFRDMHAERDFLRSNGFLRLAEQLRERSHYLDTIDLRQGVETASEADEAKREMQVLKVCLDEINRSKPFLVALLGDRYGWIPPAERIAAAARDAGLPPSVEVEGKSVTELEILYGVLENKDQQKRSWFYFRTLDRAGMPPEVSAKFPAEEPSKDPASSAGKLKALKDRIRRAMPDRWRDYSLKWDPAAGALVGLKELDEQIVKDLWSDLDAETATYLRQAPKTWQEADARTVADFVAERTRGYVERPAITDPMLAHALSPVAPDADWGLAVTGESGGGKSSIFGRVMEALRPRAEAGEIVLLAHAAGIFPMSGQVDRMVNRWVTELAAHLGVPDPLNRPETPPGGESRPSLDLAESVKITSEDIENAFASLLCRAAEKRRVVVLIDALNQFEPTVRAQYLTWLPKLWPENARFIATAILCQATATLQERKGCCELPVPPISSDEASKIARRYYREQHHRDTNPRVIEALLGKQLSDGHSACGNPLWLALALQEMNLLEADDYERADREYSCLPGAERMQALQLDEAKKLPADVSGVYGELLSRAEREFSKAWTDAFTGLIALSRAGWRESDLRALMPAVSGQPWTDIAFASVRRALGTHVVQRGAQAQWDYFHSALRNTVLGRDLADETRRRRLHGLIADHLQGLPPDDPLSESEMMHHLIYAGDRKRAAMIYAQVIDRGGNFSRHSTQALMDFMLKQGGNDPQPSIEWITSLLDESGLEDHLVKMLGDCLVDGLGHALLKGGHWNLLVRLMSTIQTPIVRRLREGTDQDSELRETLSAMLGLMAHVLDKQGSTDLALEKYQESRVVLQPLIKGNISGGLAHVWGDRCFGVAKILREKGRISEALKLYGEMLVLLQRLVQEEPSIWHWQRCRNLVMEGMARAHYLQGDLEEAAKMGEECLSVSLDLALLNSAIPELQYNMAISYYNLGYVRKEQNRLSDALDLFRQGLDVAEDFALRNPADAEWQEMMLIGWRNVGDTQSMQGDLPAMQESYQNAIAICRRLMREVPNNSCWPDMMAQMLVSLGAQTYLHGDRVASVRHWNDGINLFRGIRDSGMPIQPETQKLIEKIDNGYSLGEYVSQGEISTEPIRVVARIPSMEELRASADRTYEKCLWDAAAGMYEKLLAASDSLETMGPKLVKCLLNIHDPPALGELARAGEIINQLDSKGRSDLSAPLLQMLIAKSPPEKKGFWKRITGR